MPKLIVFASGTKGGGGSGFENLVTSKELDANIVAVVSNHEHGGVRERAERLGIPFIYFLPRQSSGQAGLDDAAEYRRVVADSGAEWVALSGWLKKVEGLDPRKTINIHPALLSQLDPSTSLRASRFGGKGMYGHHIHEAVKAAFDAGEITESGFSMHFVTDELDRGPVFFEHRVPLKRGMSIEEIETAVKKAEHEWQPKITNVVVHGEIHWDGKDPKTLVVPHDLK
jgi:phosphoribosylglycinamide formyltransferase-1